MDDEVIKTCLRVINILSKPQLEEIQGKLQLEKSYFLSIHPSFSFAFFHPVAMTSIDVGMTSLPAHMIRVILRHFKRFYFFFVMAQVLC